MAKQLNVNLHVDASVEKAKAQINDLYSTLQKISTQTKSSPDLFNTDQLRQANAAAQDLRKHLQAAVDVNTGKLNLSAFSASLKASGKSLNEYKRQLEALGPSGEEAFLKISKSIATADAPLRKTNAKLQEFATTLKNTARWQISSSIIHGFMGSLQHATAYAEDLNKSLNNIRIVTGQSIEQMDKFAEKANRAAKSLSTTTTAYTDAALIFYQQGLNDKQVEERTNVTIKMAQAAGESATEVSSYMTAIWNNFADGSKELDYYGDVMTKLGAATAASSAEIAEGLEKFAAIGETVGLSYEYATSAVATVVDKTRQSAEVVGTAFKTIFSRLQGLSLGETLEDGTDLNKYSSALLAVGINIKDANGELKDMDIILDEMGAKWQTLHRDEQMALAQTVAGVRQYTQLMSLMNNYDSFKGNVTLAENSSGTLDEQAEIYAQSWEGAQKRVEAAAENIYKSLINDEFFIDLNNAFATLLEGVGGFIDGFGGMEGILFTVGAFITQSLAKEAPAALSRIKQDLTQITGLAAKNATQMQDMNVSHLKAESKSSMTTFQEGQGSLAYAADVQMTEYIAEQKHKLVQHQHQYSEAEKAAAQQELADLEMTSEILVKKGQEYDNLNQASQNAYNTIISKLQEVKNSDGSIKKTKAELIEMVDNIQDLGKRAGNLTTLNKAFDKLPESLEETGDTAEQAKNKLLAIAKSAKSVSAGDTRQAFDDLITRLNNLGTSAQQGDDSLDLIAEDLRQQVGSAAAAASNGLNTAEQEFLELGSATGLTAPQLKSFIAILREMGVISAEVPMSLQNVGSQLGQIGPHVSSATESLMSFSGALMQMNSFMTSMKSLKDVFTDEDSTAIEKAGAVVGALTSTMMMFNAMSKLTTSLLQQQTKGFIASTIAKVQDVAVTKLGAIADGTATSAKWAQVAANWALNTSMLPVLAVTLLVAAALAGLVVTIALVVAAFKAIEANSPEGKLKAAKEVAKELDTALEEAKTSADELRESLESYDSAVEKLEECTRGTTEFNEALQAVNSEVLELMKLYPELSSMVNENGESAIGRGRYGELTIEDWAKESLINASNDRVMRAQAASLAGRQGVREAELNVKKSQVSSLDNSIAQEAFEAALAKHGATMSAEQYREVLDSTLSSYGYDWGESTRDSWAEKAEQLAMETGDLSEVMAANTKATEAENQAIASMLLADNDKVQNSGVSDEITKVSGNAYGQYLEKALDELEDDGWGTDGISKATGVNDEARKIWGEYLEAAGLENAGYSLKDTTGTDSNRAFVYTDSEGNEKSVTLETMRQAKAAAEAMGQLEANTESLLATFVELDNSTNLADHALKEFLAGQNFEGATGAQFKDIYDELGGSNMTDESIEEYLDNKFGDGKDGKISDETAQKYGYESAEAMVEAFSEGVKNYESALEDVGKDLVTPVKEVFDQIDKSELSIKGQEAVAQAMQDAFVYGGADGLALIAGAFDGMEADEAEAFANTITGLDWNTMDAATLAKTLKQAGIETEFTTETLNAFIDALSDPRIVKSFDSLAEGYATIHEVADGLELGDTISAEDFAVLGDEFETYFTRMADGTYKLTEDAEKFQEAVHAQSIDGFVQNIDKLKEQNEKLRAIQNYDFEDLSQTQNYVGEDGANYYAGGDVNKQIESLEVMGYDAEQIAKWRDDLSDGNSTVQTIDEIANAVAGYRGELENLDTAIAANEQAILKQEIAIATSYNSLKDLKAAQEEGIISMEAYSVAAMQMHEAQEMDGLDEEEMNDYADHLMEIAGSSDLVADSLADNEEAAEDVAKATMKLNRGIDTLADNFEDWNEILKESDESSQEYAEAMAGMKDAMADVLGTSEEFISNDFIIEHLEEIEKAATGDEEAIKSLQQALATDIICNVIGVADFSQLDQSIQDAHNKILELSAQHVEVGATLDDTDFLNAAQEIMNQSKMTVDEAQAYWNSLGYEPEFVTEQQTVKRSVPQERTHTDYAITEGYVDIMGAQVPIPTIDRITTTTISGYKEMDEVIEVPALSADGTPQIKSLTRTNSGGSISNYSSSNPGGKAPGKKSGGGGGSKTPKAKDRVKKDPKQLKNISNEAERYHEINEELDDLAKELDRVAEAKDRAFGQDKLNNMAKEEALLKKQIKLEQQKQEEIKKNLKLDKKKMDDWGASYDENGDINNYDELVQSQVNAYNSAYDAYINAKNAAVDAYNASARDEAADEAFKSAEESAEEVWKAAQDKYSEFQDDLAQYEETLDLFEQSKDTLTQIKNQLYDLALEKVEYIVDLKIDVAEDSLEYLEYLLEKLDDDAYDAAEAMALLGKQAEQSMKKIEAYEEGIKGIFGNHVEMGEISQSDVDAFLRGEQSGIDAVSKLDLTEDEVAKLREWKSALLEENQTLMDLRQEVRDKVLPAFQELTEEMDLQIEKIEHLQSVTESYRNIIDIVGKDYLGISDEMMGALNQAQVDMAINNLTATKAKLDGMKDARAEAQRALEEATANNDEDLIEFWQDTLEEIDSEIRDAEEDYMSSWEDALQEAAETFEESITASLDKFTDALAGEMGSLNALQAEFDRQREAAERYLPEYKQIYELSKLTRELNKATDETDNVKAKQEYKALLEEINEIEESGREISEYELKQLQAKFDLKQAELALEEAQNTKSQVRMTRDNEGNWGYVYTADQDKIDNALQNYEDKLYALNDLAYQYAKEQEDALVQLQAEFAEAIQNIQAEVGSDEWYAEVEKITAFYTEQNGYHLEQLGLALDDAGLKFTDTAFSALTGFQTAEEYQRTFNKNVGDPTQPGTLLGDITKAYEDWKVNVERAMNAAGTSTDGYAEHMMNATEQAVGDSQRLAEETVEMSETMGEKFGEVVDGVQEWEEQYGAAIDEMIRKNEELVESLNALLDKMSEVDNYNSGGGSGGGDGSGGGSGDGGGSGGGSGDGGGSGGGGGAAALATEAAEIITGVHTGTIPQTSGGWVPSAQNMGYSAGAISIARKAFNESKDGAGYSYCYEQALKLVGSYDTGGYTGEWGPEGRLAFLHQKELVLNAHDTDNMLKMIQELKDFQMEFSRVIESNARAASQGLNSMIQSTGRIYPMDHTLRQEVTIHAEFPDVEDRYEIESAFENLINRASQYANRDI